MLSPPIQTQPVLPPLNNDISSAISDNEIANNNDSEFLSMMKNDHQY
ncbi:MAG: hypothetical protein ACPKPY_00655 [Nitrososphaeraceae archaeon]